MYIAQQTAKEVFNLNFKQKLKYVCKITKKLQFSKRKTATASVFPLSLALTKKSCCVIYS